MLVADPVMALCLHAGTRGCAGASIAKTHHGCRTLHGRPSILIMTELKDGEQQGQGMPLVGQFSHFRDFLSEESVTDESEP